MIIENNIFEYSCTWLKGDFHLHTRADKEFKALKAKAVKKGVGLFPGVEFSLKEGLHILIVLDPTISQFQA